MEEILNRRHRAPASGRSAVYGCAVGTPEGRLVGRGEEVAALARLLGRNRRSAHFVGVAGEPGIGKSRLLGELAAMAGRRRCLVLAGRATEFERDVPFAPLVEALDEHLRSVGGRRLESLGRERLGELGRAFPSLASEDGGPAGLEIERYRLHRAVCALLELLGGPAPLVLLLEDVHWVDQASLELLVHLLGHPPRAPVLVAMSFRRAQVQPVLAAQLAAAARERTATLLELGPLSERETAELLRPGAAPDDRVRWLFRESGGNPFFAQQLARAAPPDMPTGSAPDPEPGVPRAVVAAIEGEISRLTAHARVLLQGAAVAGDPFELGLASAAAALTDADTAGLLDELLGAELVRPDERLARFRFRHPIVRHAVYGASGGGWRLAAHERAAGELARLGTPAALRAHHVERCARPGDASALSVLREAAADVAPRAPATAARWYEAALALTPAAADGERLELLLALGRSLAVAGRLPAAGRRVAEALDLVPREPARTRVELLGLGAGIDYLLGRHVEARARLVSALAELPAGPSPERVALQIELAVAPAYAASDTRESARAAQTLLEPAKIPDAVLRATAAAVLALRAAMSGRRGEGLRRARTAAGIIDAVDESRVAARVDALLYLGTAEWLLGSFEGAQRHLERGVEVSRAVGENRFLTPMLATLAVSQALGGLVGRARATAADAIAAGRQTGARQPLVWSLDSASVVEAHAGNFAALAPLAEEAYALAARLPPSPFSTGATALLAGAVLERGEAARALALLLPIDAGDGGASLTPFAIMSAEQRVRALLALGLAGEASAALARLDALATRVDPTWTRSLAPRARAACLLAAGIPREAAAVALAAARDARCPPVEAACCRLEAGRALAAAGDEEAAIAEFERAHRDLSACGADGFRDAAARELRRLGRRVTRTVGGRSHSGESLSDRERQVSLLVVEGMTNKQIAATLFLSESTVEKHLAEVFRKLAVSRRSAVASRLAGKTDDLAGTVP